MRCESCEFSGYSDSLDEDGCYVVSEECQSEDAKGRWGCPYTKRQLEKSLKRQNEVIAEGHGNFMSFVKDKGE